MTPVYVVDYVPVFQDMERRILALGMSVHRFCSENSLKSSNFYKYRYERIRYFEKGVKESTVRKYAAPLERLEAEY